MDMNAVTATAVDIVTTYGPKIVLSLITLWLGWKVAAWVSAFTSKKLEARGVDASLRPFLSSLLAITIKIGVVVTAVSTLGVEATSFAAILAASALAIGMALSGTLKNFAGGVMILIFRPFKVSDVIEAQGFTGKVAEIQIFQTRLLTPDNRTIYLPNGPLSASALVNFSVEPRRRVDLTFGIGYGDDIHAAREVIVAVANRHGKVLQDPAPFVQVKELADSSVNFAVRLWCEAEDYWDIFFFMNEHVKMEFDVRGISIPYPQQDVHMHQVQSRELAAAE